MVTYKFIFHSDVGLFSRVKRTGKGKGGGEGGGAKGGDAGGLKDE